MTDTMTVKMQKKRSVFVANFGFWKDAQREKQNLLMRSPNREFRIRHRAEGTFDLVEKVPLGE